MGQHLVHVTWTWTLVVKTFGWESLSRYSPLLRADPRVNTPDSRNATLKAEDNFSSLYALSLKDNREVCCIPFHLKEFRRALPLAPIQLQN